MTQTLYLGLMLMRTTRDSLNGNILQKSKRNRGFSKKRWLEFKDFWILKRKSSLHYLFLEYLLQFNSNLKLSKSSQNNQYRRRKNLRHSLIRPKINLTTTSLINQLLLLAVKISHLFRAIKRNTESSWLMWHRSPRINWIHSSNGKC